MADTHPKLAVITGSTGGLGAEMAKLLASRGWDLVLVNRSAEKGAAQAAELSQSGRAIDTVTADLLDLDQVKRAAAEIAAKYPAITALYNNSGVMTEKRVMSPGGVESHLAINVLAPYVLTEGLRAPLTAAARAGGQPMVVNVSSAVANMAKNVDVASLPNPEKIGRLTGAYANSKLALTAVSAFMKDELEGAGVKIRAIEPGGVKTKMTMENPGAMPLWARMLTPFIFKTADVQAKKVVDAADPAALGGATGVFVGINGKVIKPRHRPLTRCFRASCAPFSISSPHDPPFVKDAGLYAITVLIWGASWIGILWQVGAGVESAHALFYRYIGATLIIFGVLSLRRRALGAPLRIHALFFAQGATMFGANYLLLYIAVEMGLTTGLAAVIYSLLIIMNAFNTAIFFREAPGRAALIAAPIGIAGVALLFWTEIAALAGAGAGGAPPVALFLTVGAVYFASLGNMVSRRLQAEGVGVAVANGWAMGYGALSIGAWILVQGGPLTMSYAPGFLISLAFLTVFSTVIAFWAYLTLLGRIGADRAAYAFVAFPVVALGLSSVFEGFEWTPERLAGVALVLAGNVALLLGRRSGAGR